MSYSTVLICPRESQHGEKENSMRLLSIVWRENLASTTTSTVL